MQTRSCKTSPLDAAFSQACLVLNRKVFEADFEIIALQLSKWLLRISLEFFMINSTYYYQKEFEVFLWNHCGEKKLG